MAILLEYLDLFLQTFALKGGGSISGPFESAAKLNKHASHNFKFCNWAVATIGRNHPCTVFIIRGMRGPLVARGSNFTWSGWTTCSGDHLRHDRACFSTVVFGQET